MENETEQNKSTENIDEILFKLANLPKRQYTQED